jgi:hypothetical protein
MIMIPRYAANMYLHGLNSTLRNPLSQRLCGRGFTDKMADKLEYVFRTDETKKKQ